MAGNSIGKEFTVTTFGESHGKCIGVVIDGCPAGLSLAETDLQKELERRIPNRLEIVSGRVEKDVAIILSGVFNGFTTGAPIGIMVENKEAHSSDYEGIRDLPRPGHADHTASVKYGNFNDYRGGGRFSGRTTVALVMAGVVAKKLLETVDVEVSAYTKAIGKIKMDKSPNLNDIHKQKYDSAVRCPDAAIGEKMEEAVIQAKREGDSLGGIIECVAVNVPAGVGEPLFDSLDSDIAKILLCVPAVKGVEFGLGFKSAELKGSENNDAYQLQDGVITTVTNNAGGILGGISSGMPIVVRVAMKPTPSIGKKQKTVNLRTMRNASIEVAGRHDPCVVPKAVPVVEAAMAIVLADHMIRAGGIPKVLSERK